MAQMKGYDVSAEGIRDILSDAKILFSSGPLLSRMIQQLRPYICPFHELLAVVPKNSSVLDVGCGSGIFLGLLIKRVGLRSALGFDYSESGIELAKLMLANMPAEMTKNIDFELRNANQPWPEGDFDVVSMIDVMHHVNPAAQRKVFLEAVDHVAPGGLLLYKDMADKPFVFALANKLHDLIMARQWINYVPTALIKRWATEAGLYVVLESRCRMIWYAHEWIVFRKRPPTT
jgi:2-polyprenyl-3-methyl-5-hydroxy-6-metoxy-1,4-benzoquinol methylase